MWTNEQIIKQLGLLRTLRLRHYASMAHSAEAAGRACDAEMLWIEADRIIGEGVAELEAKNDQN